MRIGARCELSFKALVGRAIVKAGNAPGSVLDLNQHLRKIAIRCRSAHQRHMWSALEDLVAFLLGDATEHTEFLALSFQFLVVGESVKNLLLRLVPNGAGVVEHEAGLLDRWNLAVTLENERADYLLGVMRIHLATEGFEVKSLLLRGHEPQV